MHFYTTPLNYSYLLRIVVGQETIQSGLFGLWIAQHEIKTMYNNQRADGAISVYHNNGPFEQ